MHVIGPHVQAGHYDLIAPNGEIILLQIWGKVIELDWSVTMQMWPMDQGPRPSPLRPPLHLPELTLRPLAPVTHESRGLASYPGLQAWLADEHQAPIPYVTVTKPKKTKQTAKRHPIVDGRGKAKKGKEN